MAFVQAQGSEWLGEASGLRYVRVAPDAGPHAVDQLLNSEIRPRLDRLEYLRSLALSLRGTMRLRARAARDEREDAWDEAWRNMTRSGGRAGADFENARERTSRLNLHVLGETRTMRQWQIAADLADDIHEQVRQLHEGMKDVRQDAIAHLRHVVWESTLER